MTMEIPQSASNPPPDPEARVHDAEERVRALETRLAVERCARRLGIVDEEAAYQLLDTSRIERDESGAPTNVEALLSDLVARKPWLRTPPRESTPAPTPANPARDTARRLTRDTIRRMSPEQINANWEAIQAVLQEGP